MIKVIAFDLVGVLICEKDIELTDVENILEKNFDDVSYTHKFSEYSNLESITKNIINKLYKFKNIEVINKIKQNNSDIKIIIASNHVSYIKEFIENNIKNLDDIIISEDIKLFKPNKDFYTYILNKYNINPNELLFIDDNIENIISAKNLGINTIKVDKYTNIYKEAYKYLS